MNLDIWSYLRNVFDNVTKGNYKRMMLMARDHHDKLKQAGATDPEIGSLYAHFLPAYNRFNNALRAVSITDSIRQSYTMQIEAAFRELSSTLIDEWDVKILYNYRRHSPEYKLLMGNGRAPFQTGAYDVKLQAVAELRDKLATFPMLSALHAEIEIWLEETNAIRTKQQGYEGELSGKQKFVETYRADLAAEMHRVFAGLLFKFYKDPNQVETFYELKYLQRSNTKSGASSSDAFLLEKEIKVPAGEKQASVEGNFGIDNVFELTNKTNEPVFCWLSNSNMSTLPADSFLLPANETVTVYGDELTDGTTPLKYFIVENQGSVTAKIDFKLVE